MNKDVQFFHEKQTTEDQAICNLLFLTIESALPDAENKLWHSHPVWFIDGNPIVGYSKQKAGWRLMFWSGSDFEEDKLNVRGGKFKDASIFYSTIEQINTTDLQSWLKKSREIQWDYKNLIKRKGKLEKLN